MSTRTGEITEEDIPSHESSNVKQRQTNVGSNTKAIHKDNDGLSTMMSSSQCSTCVSYVCKVCGENVKNGGGRASTAGGGTCYSCSIYDGNSSIVSSEISSCNSECSVKDIEANRWNKKSSENRRSIYDSSEDGESIRSQRSVEIIPTDSDSSLTDSGSDGSILGALDSPQTG